jgi:CheY-like chemotaxis protein
MASAPDRPVLPLALHAAPSPDRLASAHPAAPGASVKILVIEDDVPLRNGLQRQLLRMGHIVVGVGSGKEAIEFLEAASGDGIPFDVAMIDVLLGRGIDGIEVSRWISRSEDPNIRATDVAMMSGMHPADVARRGEAPQRVLLTKPIDFVRLEAVLDVFAAAR